MQQLRENRARPVGDILLDNAGGQRAVDIYIINAPPELRYERGVGDAVEPEYRRLRPALAADDRTFYLQRGARNAPPHEGGVGAQGLGEAVLAALERLFHRRLADGALYLLRAHFKAHGAALIFKQHCAAALRYIGDYRVERRAPLRLRAVHGALEQSLRGKLRSRAQKLGQRAQEELGNVAAGGQAVEPADEKRPAAGKAGAYIARLKVRAAVEDTAQRRAADRPPVRGLSARMDLAAVVSAADDASQIKHIVIMRGIGHNI